MKNKLKFIIESITQIESAENGMFITIHREELGKDFDHNLNVKVYKQVIDAEHKTTYDLMVALLKIHRVYEVIIKNKIGHGMRLTKEDTTTINEE